MPVDDDAGDGHERGNLRPLVQQLMHYQGERPWEDVLLPQWPALADARAYFAEIAQRPRSGQAWPAIVEEESWNLYSASRLNDMLLLFLEAGAGAAAGPSIRRDQYATLFRHLGFRTEAPLQFHPFWCEVVEVVECAGDAIGITRFSWPALMLGNMMFSRAGVTVSAPPHLLAKGVADQSTLYWSYLRRKRETRDLSDGWGGNSQWRTDFRRDFDLDGRYAYNVDGGNTLIDLRLLSEGGAQADAGIGGIPVMTGMTIAARIDFLKHRCMSVPIGVSDSDLWPYDDYFEEVKDGGHRP